MSTETTKTTEHAPAEPVSPLLEAEQTEESELQAALAAMDAADDPEAAAASPEAPVPAEEPAKEEEPAEPASKGWAAVTAAQKKVDDDRQALKAERHEINQLKEQVETLKGSTADLAAKIQADPFGALNEIGVPFETLARQYITGKGGADVKPADGDTSEIAALKAEVAAIRQERAQETSRRNYEDYQGKLNATLESDEYQLLQAMPQAREQMLQVAVKHHQQYGEILSPKDIADTMQAEWREQLRALPANTAIAEVLGISQAAPAAATPPPSQPAATPQTPTLTNEMAPSSTPPAPLGKLSEEEDLLEAAKLISKEDWDNTATF